MRLCAHTAILGYGYLSLVIGRCDASERSNRTPDETARPARADGGRAGRQHEQGGRAPEYWAVRHFKIDRGPGTHHWGATARPQPPGRRADRIRSRLARWRSGHV